MKKEDNTLLERNAPAEKRPGSVSGQEKKIHGYRWRICALLFFATTLNYLDRHVLSILAPDLQRQIGWSEIEYGYIVAAFQAAYGIGVVLVGKLLDQWMANVYAVISDVFPQNAIGSVTGISVLSAVGGGLLYAMAVGFILHITGSYFLIFLISAFAYLLAWVVLKLGIPEIKPVDFEANNTK